MPLFGKPKSPALTSAQREAEIERLAKEALFLEARLNRPITRNDLFLSLHVPFDLMASVEAALSRDVRVDPRHLGISERERFERESHDVITRGFTERARAIQKRGITLADVAALSPRERSLADLQELFGYMRLVLEMKEVPPTETWPIDVRDLAARARTFLPADQTPFRLVALLGIGLYKAKLVKAAMG